APGCVRNVNRIADRCFGPATGVNFPPTGDCNIVNALLRLPVLAEPPLDYLHTVQVRTNRILQRGDEETRRLAFRRVAQVAACPSSNGLGQSELFRDGGSGSFGLEFRRLSTDVAIVAV